MTHDDLVKLGARHLRSTRRCEIVLTEKGVGFEIVDVIGWNWGVAGHSIMIECKANIADYYADAAKPRTKCEIGGMGAERWYLVPKGLLKPKQVRPFWGLLEVRGTRVFKVVPAPVREKYDSRNERRLLVSELRHWHSAASMVAPDLPIRTWEQKYTALANAARVARSNNRCPSCGLAMWNWDQEIKERKR